MRDVNAVESIKLICPTGKSPEILSSPFRKNNSFRDLLDTALLIPPSRLTRGAYRDRHGRGARDAMDAVGARDECIDERTAKSCGLDASTLALTGR